MSLNSRTFLLFLSLLLLSRSSLSYAENHQDSARVKLEKTNSEEIKPEENKAEAAEKEPSFIEKNFIDKEDGMFDASAFLASKKGFLPVPIIITGPTFGFGGGLNVMFLHDTFAGKKREDGKYIPPSISGIGFGGTDNGTRFAGAYHMGFFKQGDIRTMTFLGHPDANMNFGTQVGSISLNTQGYVAYQEVKFRIGSSDLFLGMNYMYMHLKITPNSNITLPSILSHHGTPGIFNYQNTAGLAAVAEFDTRDSIFTANKGIYAKAVVDVFDEKVGSDVDFINYRGKIFHFTPINNKLNLGLRAEYQHIGGDGRAPAFMTPSVILRGISNHDYQGQTSAVAEAEARFEVKHRHWLIGFAGSGKAWGDYSTEGDISFSSAKYRNAGGAGYRYQLARKFRLMAGIDIARGPTDTAFYITVGSAWNAFY